MPAADKNIACFSPYGILGSAHHAFASNHPLFDQKVFDKSCQQLRDFVKERNAPTVVSSEFLIWESAARIEHLVGLFVSSGIHVRAIFGIRAYDAFLISAYMQALKVGSGLKGHETLREYASRQVNFIRYPGLLEKWSRWIGDASIFLMDFDKNREQFLRMFFSFLNVPPRLLPNLEKVVNPSLPVMASEVLRNFDLVCDDGGARKRLVDLLASVNYKPGAEESLREIGCQEITDIYAIDYSRLTQRYTWLRASAAPPLDANP